MLVRVARGKDAGIESCRSNNECACLWSEERARKDSCYSGLNGRVYCAIHMGHDILSIIWPVSGPASFVRPIMVS